MDGEPPDYLEAETGVVLSHLLIVRDVDRPRDIYERVLEVGCHRRDTDGYLIELGQATEILTEIVR